MKCMRSGCAAAITARMSALIIGGMIGKKDLPLKELEEMCRCDFA